MAKKAPKKKPPRTPELVFRPFWKKNEFRSKMLSTTKPSKGK
jgi:hypothetical protein